MGKKELKRKRSDKGNPKPLTPSDLLHFIYEDGYIDDCEEIGLTEEDILAIEVKIMSDGKNSPVIRGTGGLRKMRFAPASWKKGKSGAVRVCFVYFEHYAIVYMITAYTKSQAESLSQEFKSLVRKLIAEAEKELARRNPPQVEYHEEP